MNSQLITLVAVAVFSLLHYAAPVGKLPASEYVDTEVTAHHRLDQPESVDALLS
jgi:hypothetical protein